MLAAIKAILVVWLHSAIGFGFYPARKSSSNTFRNLQLYTATITAPTEEYEYVVEEFEDLKSEDFQGSEWKVGTNLESSPEEIKTTWVRLTGGDTPPSSSELSAPSPSDNFFKRAGSNRQVATWGDNGKGTWSFDESSQFLSISKDSPFGLWGKIIYAADVGEQVNGYYFLDKGGIRGWSPISPCRNLGNWQGIRLGIEGGDEVRGVAPWKEEGYGEEEEEEEEEEEKPPEDDSSS